MITQAPGRFEPIGTIAARGGRTSPGSTATATGSFDSENWSHRSSSGNPDHARTVAEAFHEHRGGDAAAGRRERQAPVDATDVAMRDWNDVAGTLTRSQQGTYALARDRSTVYRPHQGLPENTEIDVALTYATAGCPEIPWSDRSDGRALTLRSI
jgi:hypothetical protein